MINEEQTTNANEQDDDDKVTMTRSELSDLIKDAASSAVKEALSQGANGLSGATDPNSETTAERNRRLFIDKVLNYLQELPTGTFASVGRIAQSVEFDMKPVYLRDNVMEFLVKRGKVLEFISDKDKSCNDRPVVLYVLKGKSRVFEKE